MESYTTKVKCSCFRQIISEKSEAIGNLSQHVQTKHSYIPIYRLDMSIVSLQDDFHITAISGYNHPSISKDTRNTKNIL